MSTKAVRDPFELSYSSIERNEVQYEIVTAVSGIDGNADALLHWLTRKALPLWATYGVDRQNGGFYERLNRDLTPFEEPRRARLVSRQIYCFAMGHELGWDGPAGELVAHGLAFLNNHLVKPNGEVLMAVSPDGTVINQGYDPYDYAFVLLGLAAAARKLGDREALHNLALRVLEYLVKERSHAQIGFYEPPPLNPIHICIC